MHSQKNDSTIFVDCGLSPFFQQQITDSPGNLVNACSAALHASSVSARVQGATKALFRLCKGAAEASSDTEIGNTGLLFHQKISIPYKPQQILWSQSEGVSQVSGSRVKTI